MSAPSGRTLRAFSLAIAACACAMTSSCEGPDALPTVRVTVSGVGRAVDALMIRGTESITVWTVFRTRDGVDLGRYRTGADAGASARPWDLASRDREVRRAVYWPQVEPFEYLVQVPPVPFTEVRVYATAGIICGGTGVVIPREKVLAAVTSAVPEFTPTMERVTDLRVTVVPQPPDCTSP